MVAEFKLNGEAREMHPIVRDEVYLIGYEAIRNAYMHSAGSRLHVQLTYGDYLSLSIRDDGTGIDPSIAVAGRDGHFGVPSMRERAARIGARLTIETTSNSGTEVKIVVPGKLAFSKARPVRWTRLKRSSIDGTRTDSPHCRCPWNIQILQDGKPHSGSKRCS